MKALTPTIPGDQRKSEAPCALGSDLRTLKTFHSEEVVRASAKMKALTPMHQDPTPTPQETTSVKAKRRVVTRRFEVLRGAGGRRGVSWPVPQALRSARRQGVLPIHLVPHLAPRPV